MHHERFESGLWQTSSLLLADGEEAVLIDPAISRSEVDAIAARTRELGLRVTHVLATHADWDHVCGISLFPDAVAAMGELSAAAVAEGAPLAPTAGAAGESGLEVAAAPRADLPLKAGVAYRLGAFTV